MMLHGLEGHLFFLLLVLVLLLVWLVLVRLLLELVVGSGMGGLCSLVMIVLVDRYAQITLH